MSEVAVIGAAADAAAALRAAHAALDALHAADLTGCSDEQLLDVMREHERLRRRLPTGEHAFINEAQARGLPETHHVRSMRQFLRVLLRLDPGEAQARVRAAEAFARRRSLTGQILPARYDAVATAHAAGSISDRHAAVIVRTIEQLPSAVRDAHADALEHELVGYAGTFDPHELARLARRISDCLDPDGTLTDAKERERLREFTLRVRPDGSAMGTGEFTAELTELLLLHFDAFAGPRPPVAGAHDSRTPGQRRHDALLQALRLNVRTKQLPKLAGVTATIVVTMTAEQYLTGAGLARTSHGAQVPAGQAFEWAAGDYRLLGVVLDDMKEVTAYSKTHRLFTENQRLIRHAIDGGCTFPDCPMPPAWCEMDHTIDWTDSHTTTVTQGGLACDYDNRVRKKQGWRPVHLNGRVAWIPPRWIDPEQRPRYNNLHRPDDLR